MAPSSTPQYTFRRKEVIDGRYEVVKTIGEGEFGKVKVVLHLESGEKVAMKIIDKTKLSSEADHKKLLREVEIMKTLQHPHIIQLYDVIETNSHLMVFMEYARGGEVFDFIVAHGKLQENVARRMFRQLIQAVDHCHKNNVVHRDLKAENLLLDEDRGIKVIDFGLSNFYSKGSNMRTFCGSPTYCAPELMNKVKYEGPEVDVWSLGCILYALVAGCLPFNFDSQKNWEKLQRQISLAQYRLPPWMSKDCVDLISKIFVVNPKKRATIDVICKHPWVMQGYEESVLDGPAESTFTIMPDLQSRLQSFGHDISILEKDLKAKKLTPASVTYRLLMVRRQRVRSRDLRRLTANFPPIPDSLALGQSQNPRQRRRSDRYTTPNTANIVTTPTTPTKSSSPNSIRKAASPPTVPEASQSAARPRFPANPRRKPDGRVSFTSTMESSGLLAELPEGEVVDSPRPSEREDQLSDLRQQLANTMLPETHQPTPQTQNLPSGRPRAGTLSLISTPNGSVQATPIATPIATPMMSPVSSLSQLHQNADAPPPPPRTVRFAVNVAATSSSPPSVLIKEAHRSVLLHGLQVEVVSAWCLRCITEDGSLELEVEVCKIPRLSMHGLRMRRRKGNRWTYKKLCHQILENCSL